MVFANDRDVPLNDPEQPRIFEDGEAELLINEPNRRYYSPHRDALLMRTMLETGVRPAEAAALRPEHVDLQEGRLEVVNGKGGKDRTLWFGARFASALQEWSDRRKESDYLFPTRKGTRTRTAHIRRAVDRYARKAGLDRVDKVSPYSFRHTFATRLYQETEDLRTVGKALGHSTTSATLVYVHVDPVSRDDVRAAMQ